MNETVDYIIKFLYAAVLAGVPLMYGTLGEIITCLLYTSPSPRD